MLAPVKVVDTVDKPENGADDAQNGHNGAADNETGSTGTVTPLRIDGGRP